MLNTSPKQGVSVKNVRTAGLIMAAGLSSRMGKFKPFLEIDGKKLIELSINCLRKGGVEDILVVIGNKADEMMEILEKYRISYIINRNFANTSMLDSIKMGVSALNGFDQFFLLPCDIPLVMSTTIKSLIEYKGNSNSMVVIPIYEGAKGHPPLIDMWCGNDILNYSGEGGLKAILGKYPDQTLLLELSDPAVLMDADTPEDFQKLTKYSQKSFYQ